MSWAKAKRAIRDVLAAIEIEHNWIGNPSAETTLDFITATGLTMVLSTAEAKFGVQSVKVTGSAGASDRIEWQSAGIKLPVIEGEPCVWSVYGKPLAGSSPIGKLGIRWYTAADVLISETLGASFTMTSGDDWARFTLEAEAPATAAGATASWIEQALSLTATKSAYFDGAFFAHGYERPYFDGTFPGCQWNNLPPTDPFDSDRIIKRVYEDPPGTIQDLPCFMILPPPVENTLAGQWRQRHYEVPVQCFVSDEDKGQAAALIDLTREKLIPAFDGAGANPLEWTNDSGIGVSLDGGAVMAYVKSVGPGVGLEYPRGSGKVYAGFEATIVVRIDDAVEFAA